MRKIFVAALLGAIIALPACSGGGLIPNPGRTPSPPPSCGDDADLLYPGDGPIYQTDTVYIGLPHGEYFASNLAVELTYNGNTTVGSPLKAVITPPDYVSVPPGEDVYASSGFSFPTGTFELLTTGQGCNSDLGGETISPQSIAKRVPGP